VIKKISINQAKNLMIQAQGLDKKADSTLAVLEQLGYVQIDTISVVERAHHHIFWSRHPKYQKADLDKLISSRKAFEYWSHAASFLPMQDYRYSLIRKKKFKESDKTYWKKDKKVMSYVYDKIKNEGPLQSKDFKNGIKKTTGWWDWKPTKMALEALFMQGDLEVSARRNFQKVYDIKERVIPSKVDQSFPTESEFARYLIRRTLNHHALATPREIAYLQKQEVLKLVEQELLDLVEDGKLTRVQIKNNKNLHFARPKSLETPVRVSQLIHILSPFDNFVIQRKKIESFYNFSYQIECYVPQTKRKYGYFSLPVLAGNEFIARVDCKADRKNNTLLVQSFHWESKSFKSKYEHKVLTEVQKFSKFSSCQSVAGLHLIQESKVN